MSKSLIQISRELSSLEKELIESDGELTQEMIEREVTERIVDLQTDFAEKIDNYVGLIQTIENNERVLKLDIDRLMRSKAQLASFKHALKERMKYAMLDLNITQCVGNKHRVTVSTSNSAVEVLDPNQLPAKYNREKITIEPDKIAIKEDLLAGVSIPGAVLKEVVTMKITTPNKLKGIL